MAKKPVVRSPLDRLPLEIRQEVYSWLTTGGRDGIGISYQAAVARLKQEHGIRTSSSALCDFYKRFGRTVHQPTALARNATEAAPQSTSPLTISIVLASGGSATVTTQR